MVAAKARRCNQPLLDCAGWKLACPVAVARDCASHALVRLSHAACILCLSSPALAQGALLDVLDGETLYDGGFLFTLGTEVQRRDTLLAGSHRVDDLQSLREQEQATTAALQWGLRHDLQIGVAASYVETEQRSTGQPLDAEGFGDVELLAKWRWLRLDGRGFATNFALLSSVSVPTGEDDATTAGNELPPDLQPGSGGIDPSLGTAVTHEPGRWRFNAACSYQWRNDSDNDGDVTGDEFTAEAAIGNRFWLEPYPGPFMRLDLVARFYHFGRDEQDGALQDSTGSERVTMGLNYAFRPRPSLDVQVYFEMPIAQHVNGTQLGADWQFDVTFGYRF